MKQAKVFFIYHPFGLTLFEPIVDLIHESNPDADCILIKAFHPYWKGFDLEKYLPDYHLTFSLPDVEYKTNIVSGWLQTWLYKKKANAICRKLVAEYENISVYTMNSAYLPVNIMLNQFYRLGVTEIFRIGRGLHSDLLNEPRDRFHSVITSSYWKIFRLFKVHTIKLPGVSSYLYSKGNPIREVLLENPYASADKLKYKKVELVLPEPFLLLKKRQNSKRDMVVIFGDRSVSQVYSSYLKDAGTFDKDLEAFFTRLKSFYQGNTIIYKPHLSDYGKAEDVIEKMGFTIYKEQKNAEIFLIENMERVKAVYAFSSWASFNAPLMGIPAYHFYKMFFNAKGIKEMDELIKKTGWSENPFYHAILKYDEIGCIDSISVEKGIEQSWRERWLDFLK